MIQRLLIRFIMLQRELIFKMIVEVICSITKAEAEEAHILIEKRNALYNLSKTLVDMPNKELQYKCENDFQKIESLYAEWWTDVINNYKLQGFPPEHLNVDAVNQSIVTLSYD